MNIKINTAKRFLTTGDIQVSTEAAAFLAIYLDQLAETIAREAFKDFESENERRLHLGIPPRRRLTAQDVRRALDQ